MRDIKSKHAGPNADLGSSRSGKPQGYAMRQTSRQPLQKRKYSAEAGSEERVPSEPEPKKVKLAGQAKPESQPLPHASNPESTTYHAQHQPSVRSTARADNPKRVSKQSSEQFARDPLGHSAALQPHPQVATPPAIVHRSDSPSPLEAVNHGSPTQADAASVHEPTDFGTLHCIKYPSLSMPLRAPSDAPCCTELIVGRHPSCDIPVSGKDAGKYHCRIVLELWQPKNSPLRRRVRVERIDLERPVYRTSFWKGLSYHQLGESERLFNGDLVQFGDSLWFRYEGPEFSSLYHAQTQLYGDRKTNSRVMRVKRLSDQGSFVVKAIPKTHVTMAGRELRAFQTLGRHPNITRFIESFYDQRHEIHYIVLEPARIDLLTYVSKMSPRGRRALARHAPYITAQVASAISHIHSHNIAHRDIKPENLLVSVTESRKLNFSVCDFGLARLNTQSPPMKIWFAGTREWMAPRSFMTPPHDDRLVDCYGLGRVLYFMITSSPWPEESNIVGAPCGCEEFCPDACVQRTMAFNTLVNAGTGKSCVDFLKHLLVGYPEECMSIGEVLKHAYIKRAVSELAI